MMISPGLKKVMPFTKDRARFLFLWVACLSAFLGSVFLLIWFLPGAIPSGNTSGVWSALAHDFVNGILYRPVFSEYGYGGTRYMPLFFVLHGVLIFLFHDPVVTGFFLTLLSAAFLDAAVYALLRTLGIKPEVAAPFAVLAHASISFQLITLEIRCDFLAAALNMWGIVCALKHERDSAESTLIFSSLAFAGAFLTKFTAVGGLATIIIYFILKKRKISAAKLSLYTIVLVGICVSWVYLVSSGNVLEAFKACAAGGINLAYGIRSPIWFAAATVQDPFFLIILIFALFLAAKGDRTRRNTFPYLYFCVTLITTMGVFASPGTDSNHLIDLLIASVLILGFQFARTTRYDRVFKWVFGIISILILLSWLPFIPSIKDHVARVGKPTRKTVKYIKNRLGTHTENILSENPLLPILFGQHPIVLDCFSLRLLAQKSPAILEGFTKEVETQFFGAVILLDWSGAPLDRLEDAMEKHGFLGVDRFYGEVHFQPGFLRLLKKHYYLSFVKRPYVIYEPVHRPKERKQALVERSKYPNSTAGMPGS